MMKRHKNSTIEFLMGLQHARYGLLIDKRVEKYFSSSSTKNTTVNSISHAFDVYQHISPVKFSHSIIPSCIQRGGKKYINVVISRG